MSSLDSIIFKGHTKTERLTENDRHMHLTTLAWWHQASLQLVPVRTFALGRSQSREGAGSDRYLV